MSSRLAIVCRGWGVDTPCTQTHACIPHNLCARIPENVSDAEAASNHLAATALHAVQRGQITIGENVVVAGLGLVGTAFPVKLPQVAGAYVMGLDHLPLRVKIAQEAGVDLPIQLGDTAPVPIAEEFTKRIRDGLRNNRIRR